ncbi:hypothetical protein PAXRUDRAFT_141717 [Paxillus rubicundulus Ve08.2h10]|uniref:Uncharacterized protein n=1 Tax=Paxillus rubicundulus Ve08.2h10 TaxID=930991 RepID=A0A0D0DCP5_9AGAM|nr:hypothetical protein PAXRUDRAFT_141717 [Paxillus rubicundulus Ve08.2h10]
MSGQPSSSTSSTSSANPKLKKRKWTREQLLKSLEILGPLAAPLPPDLPPSPPSSRSNSPAPSALKRKHDPYQDSDATKRSRISHVSDNSSQQHHHHHYHPPPPPPPSLHRPSNQPSNFNLRSEPSEDGEVREEMASITSRAPALSVLPSFVPVRRPRRGKILSSQDFDAIHHKYHLAGRLLKFSGDARFWSTYPASHKEYRPLSHPPPPNSKYHKYGAIIARLELVDALVCFAYSLWVKDYSKKACFRETWVTIEAFLGWCKNKWTTEDTFGEREKALLGLIWMIEGFIRARKFYYAAKLTVDPELDRTWAKMKSEMATLSREAEKTEMNGTAGAASQLSLASQATPQMLPSPASIAPTNSANSTPITSSSGGTPNTNSSSTTLVASQSSNPPRSAHTGPVALPPYLVVHVPNGSDGRAPSAGMIAAAANATASFGPTFTFTLKEQSNGVVSAGYCMDHAQKYLTLPILARHYPTTFARMVGTSLSVHEEHEPDIEDEEGELFWPGQCITGEGLGWVCLMGKAMVKEIGRDFGYIGLIGVVPKPEVPSGASPVDPLRQSVHR